MNAAAATPAKPYRAEIWGILPYKKRIPHGMAQVPKKTATQDSF